MSRFRIRAHTPVGVFSGAWKDAADSELGAIREFFESGNRKGYLRLETEAGTLYLLEDAANASVVLLEAEPTPNSEARES